MHEYRVVLNQCGAAIELHNHGGDPVTLLLLSPARLEYYRDQFEMGKYAAIGAVAIRAAKHLVTQPYLVSTYIWQYNASTEQYSIAN